jgi:hypothetical protein
VECTFTCGGCLGQLDNHLREDWIQITLRMGKTITMDENPTDSHLAC